MAGRQMTAAITSPKEVSIMKLTSIFAMTIGAAAGMRDVTSLADSSAFLRSLEAPPEALIIGGGLLMVAALLRHTLSSAAK
jgi:hypothetical protein